MMERLTTDNPQNNTEVALNLVYVKDGQAWVRNGRPDPGYPDVTLYDYMRLIIADHGPMRFKADITDDELGDALDDALFDGIETNGRAAIELAYYHKAEQEGRLLVLPCKVGDTVYTIIDGKIYEGEVYHISYSDYYGKVTSAVRTKTDLLTASIGAAFEDFGKTAFFTRAAAEAALAKERDADAL